MPEAAVRVRIVRNLGEVLVFRAFTREWEGCRGHARGREGKYPGAWTPRRARATDFVGETGDFGATLFRRW